MLATPAVKADFVYGGTLTGCCAKQVMLFGGGDGKGKVKALLGVIQQNFKLPLGQHNEAGGREGAEGTGKACPVR